MHDHAIFDYLNENDYLKFCTQEMELREIVNYPPYARLIQIELKNSDPIILEREASAVCHNLNIQNEQKSLNLQILGPARPMIYKIQKLQIRHIFIKSKSFGVAAKLLENVDFSGFES